ncbi:MAG: DEAD/DEAH box helicase [bacterium]
MEVKLRFERGTLVLENWGESKPPPSFTWDRRHERWRAFAMAYASTLRWLQRAGHDVQDGARNYQALDLKARSDFDPRPYQREALQAWERGRRCGSVVLPTGTGKSIVALKAIEAVGLNTLVVSPTIDLMNQWYDLISGTFGREIGILGGGYHEVKEITVTTYDSAYLYIDQYGDRFGLLVFDEVHHLPAPKSSHIPQMSIAPYRLGLTATYRRLDGLHLKLRSLIGPVVYKRSIKDFKGEHLSDYEIVRISVPLNPEERTRYDRHHQVYSSYARERGVAYFGSKSRPWENFIRESAYDPEARKALLARREALKISSGARRKMEVLESLIKQHHSQRVIIFTENNDLVYRISSDFLIPAITHQTKTVERRQILDRFRKGIYRLIVTSKVLNEGVDIPEANVAIILSGSASPREHLQRLGRILRKRSGKKALLYEVVTKGTKETGVSYRRRASDAYRRSGQILYR